MAVVFSIDKFMSENRALTNIIGNGVATVVVSAWEGELDRGKLKAALSGESDSEAILQEASKEDLAAA
jgi:aerobic C4-dicarboxylate transport protein